MLGFLYNKYKISDHFGSNMEVLYKGLNVMFQR